jgi:hypothetical protein
MFQPEHLPPTLIAQRLQFFPVEGRTVRILLSQMARALLHILEGGVNLILLR